MPFARKLRRPLLALAWIVTLGAFYVLSVGPAAFLFEKFDVSDQGPLADVVFTFYAPLSAVPEDTALGRLLRCYIQFFGGLGKGEVLLAAHR